MMAAGALGMDGTPCKPDRWCNPVNGVAKNLPSPPTHGGVEPKLWHCRPFVPLGKACVHWASTTQMESCRITRLVVACA